MLPDGTFSAGLCSDPSLLVASSPPLGSSAMVPIEGVAYNNQIRR